MAVKVLLFGQMKQLTGHSELIFGQVPDTDQLKKELINSFPQLGKLPFLIAVNKELIQTNTTITEGQELALLPPYSGG
jgi:molybdopterin converting factor small subunit